MQTKEARDRFHDSMIAPFRMERPELRRRSRQLFQRSTVSLIGLTKARPSARLFSHSRFSC